MESTMALAPRRLHSFYRHLFNYRSFTTFSAHPTKAGTAPLAPRKIIPESDLIINYLKGSGPGGQKINKTSSAVQIKHLPTGIVIKCQETRSRDQNEKLALRKIQDRLEEMEKGEDSRVARRRELLKKRKASKSKKAKRKYKALEGEDVEGEEFIPPDDFDKAKDVKSSDGSGSLQTIRVRKAMSGDVGYSMKEHTMDDQHK